LASGQDAAIIMAARTLDSLAQPFKTFFPASGSMGAYYRVRRQWTGAPATSTQRMAWPRTGMYSANGFAIDPTVIPDELKYAQAELAGQLLAGDRTLDNDVVVQGITSIRAGSVSLGFKDAIATQVIPDAVYNLLPTSWLAPEAIEPVWQAQFEVI
jgi:hypothetical protein